MDIEILHIDDCPNWRATADTVTEILADLGASEPPVRLTLLASPAAAALVPFAGSPTVLIDGTDAFPTDGRTSDLACRVYRVDGRFAGAPSADDLRTAISAALDGTRER